jgi:hypothetical protein
MSLKKRFPKSYPFRLSHGQSSSVVCRGSRASRQALKCFSQKSKAHIINFLRIVQLSLIPDLSMDVPGDTRAFIGMGPRPSVSNYPHSAGTTCGGIAESTFRSFVPKSAKPASPRLEVTVMYP